MILDNSLLKISLYLSIRVFPLPRLSSSPASLTLFKYFGSAGIFTCYPSATLFSLTLGPDLPWADEPSPGNLRLSTAWILTMLSLLSMDSHHALATYSGILSSISSICPFGHTSTYNRMLLYHLRIPNDVYFLFNIYISLFMVYSSSFFHFV